MSLSGTGMQYGVCLIKERCRKEKGFALFSVLVILAVMTPLVVNLSYRTRVQLSGADYLASKVRSREIARAGLESAIIALKKDEKDYDSYMDEWGEFRALSELSGTFLAEGRFKGTITDEEGKLNMNRLTPGSETEQQLIRLFETLKFDTDALNCVIDWIDGDSEETGVTGAEDGYYSSLENPYNAKDNAMDTLNELRLIKGVTDDILFGKDQEEGLYSFVSVYGSDTRININTAPYEVLAALSDDLSPSAIDDIMTYREGEPVKELEELNTIVGEASLNAIRSKVKVTSSVFSILIKGEHREVVTDIEAVVRRSGDNLKIIYYSEA